MEGARVHKAVIPVAGLGTRMLPATKAIPKELLPILNKPIIQYVVEEAISAGIKEIIFITRSGKEAIENHFDKNYELELMLEKKGKRKILKSIKNLIPSNVKISSIRQENALGLGHAIHCAKHLIKNEPFAVLLPDEILLQKNKFKDFSQMLKLFEKSGKGQILVEKVSKRLVSNYGVVDIKRKPIKPLTSSPIYQLVEKPIISSSPSNLRIVGRYILPSEIMSILSKTKKGRDGEIQLTDALEFYIKKKPAALEAFLSDSFIFDCGSIEGFLNANIAFADRSRK
jgi:UTP--glucose-1-phosphate uridylyltransferase